MGFTLLIAVGTLTYITLMHILPEVFYADGHEDHDHFGNDEEGDQSQLNNLTDQDANKEVDGATYERLIANGTGEETKSRQLVQTLINSD